MSEIKPPLSDAPILDFYEIDERLVAVNRLSHEVWVWDDSSWRSDASLIQVSETQGKHLSQDDFVHRFPGAALALLDGQQALKG